MNENDLKVFVEVTKDVSELESRIITLHERRIGYINKFRGAIARKDFDEATKFIHSWVDTWEKIRHIHAAMQEKLLNAAEKLHDEVAGPGFGCELGIGDDVSGWSAESKTKP